MSTASSRRPATKKFDSLEQQAYLELWRAYDCLKALEDELFAKHDLSAQQYNALRLLRSVHPETMSTSTLGSRLVSRAPDMTRLLDKLEERRLVHRERKPGNRRVVEVGITAGGIELVRNLAAPVRECHKRQLGHLGEKALHTLIAALEAVRKPHEADDTTITEE
jgi:DNA-binding MarR family transcriptional regulator